MSRPFTLTNTFTHISHTHTTTINWVSIGSTTLSPLIFIHGTPWSSLVWAPFALSLSRSFCVYLFDNPGFGTSPLPTALPSSAPASEVERLDADLARQSEAFAALFKFWEKKEMWEGRKPHIVAHDHGGLMSLRANLLHACEFKSLCLIDVVAIGPFGQSLFKSVAENPKAFENLPDTAFGGIVESYIKDAAHTELSRQVVDMLKEPWLKKEGKEGFVRQLCQANSRSTEEVEGKYSEVGKKMPVKIAWGLEDKWIEHGVADRLGQALGAREVVKIEEAGHLIMYDQPARLGVEIASWLTQVECGGR